MPSLTSFVRHATTDYHAFHPPLIRLQQTAPHPQGRRVLWALLGRLDIVAVAEGKLVPASYLKIVQPSEAGIVKEILVRMDALITEADLDANVTEHARKRLALERIDAELTGQPFQPVSNVPTALVREVTAQHQANRDALAAALAEERSRLGKGQQELAAARQQKTKLEAVLPHYKDQDKAYEKLVKDGFAGTLMGSDKRRERNEAQSQLDKLVKELEKQQHRRALMELKAPQDGVIKDLATHTSGTVVQPGTVLASLVPQEEKLKVEVWVSNEDIGFVRPGQPGKLKFAAYPFQKYGMGHGTVEHVSADAQSEEEARDKGLTAGGQRPLRYKALVALDTNALNMEGRQYPLSVGMQTAAEILLGDRTVAEYLLSPVQKAWHEAGRER